MLVLVYGCLLTGVADDDEELAVLPEAAEAELLAAIPEAECCAVAEVALRTLALTLNRP